MAKWRTARPRTSAQACSLAYGEIAPWPARLQFCVGHLVEADELRAGILEHRPFDRAGLLQHHRDRALLVLDARLHGRGQQTPRRAAAIEHVLPAKRCAPAFQQFACRRRFLEVDEFVALAVRIEPRARRLHRIAVDDAIEFHRDAPALLQSGATSIKAVAPPASR